MDKKYNRTAFILFTFFLALIFTIGIYLLIKYGQFQNTVLFIEKNTPPAWFITLMLILPVVGFPISIFLIVGGIKFGIFDAILLWLLILPIHALIGYYLSKLLRKPLIRLSNQMGYPIPNIPKDKTALVSFLFLAFPGIPYAFKNYLLPLAGIPFYYCIFMNSIVQGVIGIPFIVLGKSAAELNLSLLYIAIILFIAAYIILQWMKKKYGAEIPEAED